MTLSPTVLPSPMKNLSKFGKAAREILTAEDKEEDHPDTRETRRRVWGNLTEMINKDII